MSLRGYIKKGKPANWRSVAKRDQPLTRNKPEKYNGVPLNFDLKRSALTRRIYRNLAQVKYLDHANETVRIRVGPKSKLMNLPMTATLVNIGDVEYNCSLADYFNDKKWFNRDLGIRNEACVGNPKARFKTTATRTRIRPRSRRMTKLMAYYNERRAAFLLKHPRCKWHTTPCKANQVHHSRGRVSTLLLDERFWIPLCAGAHDFVGEHPNMAREQKLLCAVGDWNRAPHDAVTRKLQEKIKELTR